jgi:hypothetical protein
MPSSRLRRVSIVVAVGLAGAFTIWAIAVMVSHLMRGDGHPPWALYLLRFLMLTTFWSGLSLLRWRSNVAILVVILSGVLAVPLGDLEFLGQII